MYLIVKAGPANAKTACFHVIVHGNRKDLIINGNYKSAAGE